MAQVLMPRRRQTQLEAINQALQIGGAVFGIKNALDKSALLEEQTGLAKLRRGEAEKVAEGITTPEQQQKLAEKGFTRLQEGQAIPKGSKVFQTRVAVRDEKTGEEIGSRPAQFFQAPKRDVLGPLKEKDIRLSIKEKEDKPKKELIVKREKIDKDFRNLERLYGGIDALEQKFVAGKLNNQDRIQLLRSLVPLSEVNPGVVREAEVALTVDQQSALSKMSTLIKGQATGAKISDDVIKELFDSAKTLRPVTAGLKFAVIKNIADQAQEFGVGDKLNLILGSQNLKLLQDPEKFAQFAERAQPRRPERVADQQEQKTFKNPEEERVSLLQRLRRTPKKEKVGQVESVPKPQPGLRRFK
jgi:hypothetical protein